MQKADITFSKSQSWKMFNEISPRYDFLNHLLSFGLDIRWRAQLARFLSDKPDQIILDLATGTADVLLSIFQNRPDIQHGYGIDLADHMLKIGRHKIAAKGLASHITLKHGDACRIPFQTNSFDAVTMAFGIRNVEDPMLVLKEMCRILKTEGKALILEFSLPLNQSWRRLHLLYLRHGVPLIGSLISGHYQAYRYLNRTIESFPYGDNFCQKMKSAGFKKVKVTPLMFGVASIYIGEKE